MSEPIFTNDAIVFGILLISLGFVFYTENIKTGFLAKFYKIVPGLFMAYFVPALFTTFRIIAPEWETENAVGEVVKNESQLYYVASRFLLPTALVLMTLSIDLKAIFNLGSKALVMFFTGTIGIIIGGPIAILLISIFSFIISNHERFNELTPSLNASFVLHKIFSGTKSGIKSLKDFLIKYFSQLLIVVL